MFGTDSIFFGKKVENYNDATISTREVGTAPGTHVKFQAVIDDSMILKQ